MTTNRHQTPSDFARLASVARPELRGLLWGLLFLAVSSLAGLTYPQIIRRMMDDVIVPKKLDLLATVVGGFFILFLIQGVASSIRYYLFTMSGERIVNRLRERLYARMLAQELAFFDFNRTGDLMSRLASDCNTLQNTVSVNVSMVLRNLGQVVGGLGFMFYTSWRLTGLMLLLLPPTAIAAAVFGRRIRRHAKAFQESLGDSSIAAYEAVSGIRTVKSFVQEANEVKRYNADLAVAITTARNRIVAIAQFITIAMFVGSATAGFVLWYGGREVILDRLSGGDLMQFLLYLMLVAIGVGSLGNLWGDFMSAIGATKRVFEILDREPAEAETLGGELEGLVGRLEFENIRFTYPARPDSEVLRGLSFVVEPGQMVALVGPSGSGKTTVASLLTRFYEPAAGVITLDRQPINQIKASWLRTQIGLVSQEPILLSTSIEDNIRYGKPSATPQEIREAAADAGALEFIERFPEGFQTRVGEKGAQLSGGQKQRVAIARAILKNPKILLLDEATSNLDSANEKIVQESLARLMKGRTTLVIAHRLATVQDADLILVIEHGEIVQKGRHNDLAADPAGLYSQLLRRQFRDIGA